MGMDRLIRKVEEEEDWAAVLDMLAAALLTQDSVSSQPLLVTAALHPVGHILAREIVSKANILTLSREALLCVLEQYLETLRYNETGVNVLKGLYGVVVWREIEHFV